jgi:hypothetical protein
MPAVPGAAGRRERAAGYGTTHAPNAPHGSREKGQFLDGHPKLGGRRRGSRNKLGEAFIAALYADWKEHGEKVIAEVRAARPAAYLKVVASLLPKQVEIKDDMFDDLTDEQLAFLIRYTRTALGLPQVDGEGTASPPH